MSRIRGEIPGALAAGPRTLAKLMGLLDCSRVALRETLKWMIAERAIVGFDVAGVRHYRLPAPGEAIRLGPPVKQVALPAFSRSALEDKLLDLCASGASYEFRDLATACRTAWPQIDDATVTSAVTDLVHAGRLTVVHLGQRVRYRRSMKVPDHATATV